MELTLDELYKEVQREHTKEKALLTEVIQLINKDRIVSFYPKNFFKSDNSELIITTESTISIFKLKGDFPDEYVLDGTTMSKGSISNLNIHSDCENKENIEMEIEFCTGNKLILNSRKDINNRGNRQKLSEILRKIFKELS